MLRRPQPTDSDSDLLREQEHFLSSGARSAASVVRRPDKRRGQAQVGAVDGQQDQGEDDRDVVSIEDLPDEMPSLTPAPPKKSRFKSSRVTFEDEAAEARLDRHDTHISAVLSRIIERDTTSVPVTLPEITGLAFPKVPPHSEQHTEMLVGSAAGRKKSIFACQIAAQRLKEGKAPLHCAALTPQTQTKKDLPLDSCMKTDPVAGSRLITGQGLKVRGSSEETMRIHRESQEKLQAMSESEILEEQKELLSQLNPRLADFVRARKTQSVPSSASSSHPLRDQIILFSDNDVSQSLRVAGDVEMEPEEQTPLPVTEADLPVKPQKDWVHMNKLEPEKLEWMRDLPPPRKKETKNAMQARFDFAGILIPPTEDLPTHLGLHHHGEEPERAGYSLQELFLLSRSQLIQQRSLALSTLANILSKARSGEYSSFLKGSVLSSLLDAGLLFLLRFSLDDSVEGVMSAAVHALHSLLVCAEDEACMDHTFAWFGGMSSFPLLPSAGEEEDEGVSEHLRETAKEMEEKKSDYEVARQDVIKGLLKMKLLPRLRYILEVVRPSPRAVQDILEVLTRIARHSTPSAVKVLDCPRLMEVVVAEFLPTSWTTPPLSPPQSLYGLPQASALKLLRVLSTAGRHLCARILHSLGVKQRLSCLISAEPGDLLLDQAEALRISTEAYRLWAVASRYGQASNLFIDLYPALVKSLQSVGPLVPLDPLVQVRLQRVEALVCLLTQVTHTAGCHQELQAAVVNSSGEEVPSPPAVTWAQVCGLQQSMVAQLKGYVKALDSDVQKDISVDLIPVYLVYLQAYYHQLSKQNSFSPVETLEELERLMSELLVPLLSHCVVHNLMKNLRSFSVVCNPVQSGAESTPSLPGLACPGWRDRPGLAAPTSPCCLLTGLGLLLETVIDIHKGLTSRFSGLLVSESVLEYLHSVAEATPSLSHTRAWLLRHEHHLLYLLLRLAHRLVPIEPDVAKHASLYHQVALVLLPWLLPGSEYFAYELLSTIIFNKDFILEGHSGGPEALELGELRLNEEGPRSSPSLQTLGSLLREACVQLPSLRACFLTQLAHMESVVVVSQDSLLGRTPWIRSQLLPELSGPILPSDWPYLPLVSLYEQAGVSQGRGLAVEELPQGALLAVTHCLQWLLMLEVWREDALKVVPPVAKVARLSCVFLCSSDLFLERPVQKLMWALFRLLTRVSRLDSLDLGVPPPGLASFQDLFSTLLAQYEAVSFGERLFGCWILLPLQRRYSVAMKLAVFGEHVGTLRSLGVTLEQLSIPLVRFTSPPEDSLPLLHLYFHCLLTGALRQTWCPVLYAVALCHINSFIFSQNAAAQEVETARTSMLRKIYYLTDEALKKHLLLFHLPQQHLECGFDLYDELPPIRARHLERVLGSQHGTVNKGD